MVYAPVVSIFLPFIIALFAYLLFFLIFKRISYEHKLIEMIFKEVRKAILTLLLIIAALIAEREIIWPKNFEPKATHTLFIALIATIGVAIALITRSTYKYVRLQHEGASLEDFSRRSFVTQIQILYRAVMFAIFAITIGAILMTFPMIKSFGIGILGSAGIVGIAVGLAARPILSNFIAGFQIAFTNMLRIGDLVVVEKEQGRVEHIFHTHVIVKLWDYRRVVIPISYFIDKPFENWSASSTELFGVTYLFCDIHANLHSIRKKFEEIVEVSPLWNKDRKKMEVADMTENAIKLRFMMTAATPQDASDLQNEVREKLVEFLQTNQGVALPKIHYEEHHT